MNKTRQLQPQDTMFIGGESYNVYQHTGGLVILDSRDDPDFGFEAFREFMIERMSPIPHFRWKLHEVPLNLDLPYWVEDEDFSFDRHIRRIAVPSPGDSKALSELVSFLYARHLDRSHPLWEAWFIEGLEGGGYAIFQKLHHCLMDGEGAQKIGEILTDFSPNAKPKAIDPALTGATAGDVPKPFQEGFDALRRLYGLPLKVSREAAGMIMPALKKKVQSSLKNEENTVEKPGVAIACFNHKISEERGFVFGSLPLNEIIAVKDHFKKELNATVNDVILALISGSLRNYLLAMDELPERSLRTSIAVSIRSEDDDQFSNRITIVGIPLATDEADPIARLQTIARESGAVKKKARSGNNKSIAEVIQMLPPALVPAIMTLPPPEQVIKTTGYNLIVSNVRGSERPMYMRGVKQVSMYPMSILAPGMGINITCLSYNGNVDVGITIEPSMFPQPWSLIDGLQASLDDYKALIRKKPARKKSTVTSSKATTKPKPGTKTTSKAKPKPKAKKKAPARQRNT